MRQGILNSWCAAAAMHACRARSHEGVLQALSTFKPFFNLPKTGDGKSSDAAPSPFYDLLSEAYEVVNYD